MREQLAIRIHTSERTNARILYEASPINTSWEDLTEVWREYYRKQADQILSYQRKEIEKVENPYSYVSSHDYFAGFATAIGVTLALLK